MANVDRSNQMEVEIREYVIVVFTKDNEVGVAPSDWLLDECTIKWPNKKGQSLNKAVLDRMPPEDHWDEYDVRVIYSDDDYVKVRGKLSSAEDTSSLETDDPEAKNSEIGPRICTRKRKPTQRLVSESDNEFESDDHVDLAQLTIPKPPEPISNAGGHVIVTPKRRCVSGEVNRIQRTLTPLTNHEMHDSDTSRSSSPQREIHPAIHSTPYSGAAGITQTERKILQVLAELQQKVDMNTGLLQTLLRGRPASTNSSINLSVWPQGLPALPLSTMDGFNTLNDKVMIQHNADAVVRKLSMRGGDSVDAVTRNVLTGLMTNSLASQFNWMGHERKKRQDDGTLVTIPKKAISTTNLLQVINRAVRDNPVAEMASDDVIKKTAQSWFKYAASRKQEK
ncbi:uncharacterized protein LOC143226246 isoform X2 [Tachypleus tridentatus]|uniref:uncharacterized protein LOC143226246 isoform X2 n=1 Tax=Tachypleus tridentatus TaxID=6853 RepID=UPI003FD14821